MAPSNKYQQEVLEIIRSLAPDEDLENPEYDRALVEVGAHLLGLDGLYADNPDLVTSLILGER